MSTWTRNDLDRIAVAEELEIAPARSDGSLTRFTTIWVVRVGDDLYVRAYRGRTSAWFRHALQHHEGRIRAGGVERDVRFEEPSDANSRAIDDAYRTKYSRHSASYVDPMVAPEATAATLQLVPG